MKSETEIKEELEYLRLELPKMLTEAGINRCEASIAELKWVLDQSPQKESEA